MLHKLNDLKMNGLRIKEILQKNGLNTTALAEKLGISNQNLFGMLSRDDIRTGLLERISEASGIPLSEFYGFTASATASGDHSTAVAGNNIKLVNDKFLSELAAQRQLTEQALNQNDKLIGIIEKMTK